MRSVTSATNKCIRVGFLAAFVCCSPNTDAAAQTSAKSKAPANSSQTRSEDAAQHSAWAVSCKTQVQDKLQCEMLQSVVDQRGGQLALISIKGASDGPSSVMLVRIPHGAYLPAGISLAIDTAPPQSLVFQKSDRLGAYAALPLNEKLLADLTKGKELRLSVQINKGEDAKITGSLAGFGSAYDKISKIR